MTPYRTIPSNEEPDVLSQHTGLTANTLSKIFSRSVAVDKRSLWVCFSAFNLDLDGQDYLSSFTLADKDRQFSHWGINMNCKKEGDS